MIRQLMLDYSSKNRYYIQLSCSEEIPQDCLVKVKINQFEILYFLFEILPKLLKFMKYLYF